MLLVEADPQAKLNRKRWFSSLKNVHLRTFLGQLRLKLVFSAILLSFAREYQAEIGFCVL